jgi:hypothetical protein
LTADEVVTRLGEQLLDTFDGRRLPLEGLVKRVHYETLADSNPDRWHLRAAVDLACPQELRRLAADANRRMYGKDAIDPSPELAIGAGGRR